VLEVHSGNVLAIASLPSFDPANPGASPAECWRLRAVQDAFEPGSTIKPLIAVTALACPHIRPDRVFDCRQRGATVAGHWIRDHAEPGLYDLAHVIAQSSNSGIIELALDLAPELIWRTLRAFGLGERTGVGFPAEARGLLAPVDRWSAMSRAGVALGQELTASPLQIAVAYAAIANRGWLPQPHLVARVGSGPEGATAWKRRVMDSEIAAQVVEMLELVVLEGTGKQAQIPGYRVAGKTGTAQRPTEHGFDDSHHVAWFAGFLPLPDPQVVVVVAIEEPDRDFWASSTAAPLFARIGQAATEVLDIPPEQATRWAALAEGDAPGRAGGST
jgi:cell division protein FtsI/penicillin-binding protein 2